MAGTDWALRRAAAGEGCSTSVGHWSPVASWNSRHARRAPRQSAVAATGHATSHSRSSLASTAGLSACNVVGSGRCPRTQQWRISCRSAAPASPLGGADSAFGDSNTLAGMLMAYAMQLQQQQQQGSGPRGSEVRVDGIGFHPPGTEKPLLHDISMVLPANSLGLVMGRSGSGKTTLLQVLAGLTEQTSGHVVVLPGGGGAGAWPSPNSSSSNGNGNGNGNGVVHLGGAEAGAGPAAMQGLTVEERMQRVGLVFQFPERHFLGEDLMQELTFTWPRLPQYWGERQAMSSKMQQVLHSVGLENIPLDVSPWALSGGQQRRLALAIQLVRQPSLLLLDEPLAGLDWASRQEVVGILRKLKEQCTLLVVSHDLAEIAPLVDCAWRMRIGGSCEAVAWPPSDLAGLEQ